MSRFADWLAQGFGSWQSFVLHAIWFGVWIVLPVEPFPFGLLTMVVSLEAIFVGILILMSANSQAARDRVRDNRDDREVGEILEHAQWTREEMGRQTADLAAIARALKAEVRR